MRKFLVLLALLVFPALAAAQNTTVFATVVDPNGNPYAGGTVSASLSMPVGIAEAIYISDGTPVQQHPGPSGLDSVGHFSISLPSNDGIIPAGTQWTFTICGIPVNIGPRGNVAPVQICFNAGTTFAITGASISLTTQLNSVAKILGPALGSGGGGGPGTCSIGLSGPGGIFGITGTPAACDGVLGFNVSGPSGSIPYFIDGITLAASAALTANAYIEGGGPGVAPFSGTITDDLTNPPRSPNGLNIAAQYLGVEAANANPGTVAQKLACISGATSTVVVCPVSPAAGTVRGIAEVNAGTTGSVVLAISGRAPAIFDNQSVIGDFAIPSTTVVGDLHDIGSAVATTGLNYKVDSTNSGAGTVAFVIPPGDSSGGSSGTGLVSCLTTLGDIWSSTTGGVCQRLGAPTTPNGVVQFIGSIPAAGVGTNPAYFLAGLGDRTFTTADTVLVTDRTKGTIANSVGAVGQSLPQAGSAGFGSNFAYFIDNINTGDLTVTPTISQVNGAATLVLHEGEMATVNSPDNANYNARTFSPPITAGAGLTPTRAPHGLTLAVSSAVRTRGISFTIGSPGGTALTAAATTTDYITVPFACTISAYNLAIDAGTITVKFWKVATGTAIPTSGNSINTSGVSIASGTAIHSTTVSDFTNTAVAANDILAMNVTTVATAAYVNGVLQCDQ